MALKEAIRERLQEEAQRIGEPDLLEKIASEQDAIAEEEVAEHLTKTEHPALTLEPMI